MDRKCLDINCDVGEGVLHEPDLYPFISSCNIACGGHFGDDVSMGTSIRLAMENNVKIGAHPAYPDPKNFGRVSMSLSKIALKAALTEQLESFGKRLEKLGGEWHHIKAHGALYNDMVSDASLAQTYLEALQPYRSLIKIYAPWGSVLGTLAMEEGYQLCWEAFLDRQYLNASQLVPRSEEGSLLTDPEMVFKQLLELVQEQHVTTRNTEKVFLKADTYCIHGDTPTALQILMYLSEQLTNHNLEIDA